MRRVDASTSPRPWAPPLPRGLPLPEPLPELESRSTQTPPVVCEPIKQCGEYQWVASELLQPDLSFYVSCFSD